MISDHEKMKRYNLLMDDFMDDCKKEKDETLENARTLIFHVQRLQNDLISFVSKYEKKSSQSLQGFSGEKAHTIQSTLSQIVEFAEKFIKITENENVEDESNEWERDREDDEAPF